MSLFRISADFTLSLPPSFLRECHICRMSRLPVIPVTGTSPSPALNILYETVRHDQARDTVGPLPEDYLAFWRPLFAKNSHPLLHLCGQGQETAEWGVELLRDEFPAATVYLLLYRSAAAAKAAARTVACLRDSHYSAAEALARLNAHPSGTPPLFF